jgi:uncharacterized protein (TIGR03000 family)
MYSVVMMVALTGGAEVPDCHRGGCAGNGCAGYAACGCHGRGHGRRGHGCNGGGYGCYGGGYGYGCAGGGYGYGCAGGGYIGGHGCAGGGAPLYYMPGAGGTGGGKLPPPIKGKGKDGGPTTQAPTTGTIVVNLPAEASLTVDGTPTSSTSNSRLLVSSDLQPGYEYYYTLRAETVRDGQTVAQTQRVAVRPGEQTVVSFDFASNAVASSR